LRQPQQIQQQQPPDTITNGVIQSFNKMQLAKDRKNILKIYKELTGALTRVAYCSVTYQYHNDGSPVIVVFDSLHDSNTVAGVQRDPAQAGRAERGREEDRGAHQANRGADGEGGGGGIHR
jgi:hypothetical protein